MIGKGTLRIRATASAFLPPRNGYLVMDAKKSYGQSAAAEIDDLCESIVADGRRPGEIIREAGSCRFSAQTV